MEPKTMRNRYTGLLMAATIVIASAACATKGYVTKQVTDVNEKIEGLSRSVEDTQERTRKNETRIGEVDQKAAQADQKAGQANQRAEQAGLWAKEAESSAARAGTAAAAASAKAEAVDQASKRLLYQVILSEDQGNFKFGKADLPASAKTQIDELINQLKADPRGAFIEIEGHTDSIGSKQVNERVGLERAEAVKRYLYEKHEVPLHKMNVISYGEDKPIASNKTKAGRAKNRRVVIKVLA